MSPMTKLRDAVALHEHCSEAFNETYETFEQILDAYDTWRDCEYHINPDEWPKEAHEVLKLNGWSRNARIDKAVKIINAWAEKEGF